MRVATTLAITVAVTLSGCAGSDAPPVPSDPVEWLASQAIPVASVDPANRDFSDLQALRDVIGDSRVVMLGEQSHGDGTERAAAWRRVR